MVADGLYDHFHTLQQVLGINAAQHKAAFVKGCGELGADADAHGGERVATAGEEAALLGQGTAVGYHAESAHLQAVIATGAQEIVLDHAGIELEP